MGVQIFARDLGPIGDYGVKADWFYLDYRWRDWLGVRAGRNKIPFGLYNDASDADSARVPVLLPQSVYPTRNRDFLLAQTGVEVYGYLGLGPGGALDYRRARRAAAGARARRGRRRVRAHARGGGRLRVRARARRPRPGRRDPVSRCG